MGVHHHRSDRPGQRPFKGKSKGRVKASHKGRIEHGLGRSNTTTSSTKRPLKYSNRSTIPSVCPRLIALLPCSSLCDIRSVRNILLTASGASPQLVNNDGPITISGLTFIEGAQLFHIFILNLNIFIHIYSST